MEVRQSSTYTYTFERHSSANIAHTESVSMAAAAFKRAAPLGSSERRRVGLASGSASGETWSMLSGTVPNASPSGTSAAPCSKKGSRHPATSAWSVRRKEVSSPPVK